MIEVEHLRKTFGANVAVDDVSFTARPGRVFGLLGPNGAGKSTTIGSLCGLVRPDGGSARLCGRDVTAGASAREGLGLVPQDLALYEELTAPENLRFFGAAQGLRGAELERRVAQVLARVGLADRAKEPVSRYSGGMKRRLNFACGVVHGPRVLLLDEPTVGIDPQSRVALLDLVREEAAVGSTVLYTTHYMEEAEALCDDLAIVDHGRVIASGTLDELRARVGERDLLHLDGTFDGDAVRAAFAALESLADVEVVGADAELVALAAPRANERLPELFAVVQGAGGTIRATTLRRPSLENLFIELTGREYRE
ncbi:ABC transporter ATP-binding protein [Engelhardtia mirabilis]|uniref:Doxorubicin resistance ATP-binding protein DrrA n=1 Tax=Engelhardtia mirabilis TaxID=2528011 RepID=A0A518BRB9_9BACT|nr:Doxorubicin resistance ATP-binding protein DrrA [Planctomycetes bacterium Pla133]QDV03844.1 Doxorubicin resistance ATP-binding protein DrrA [Planctomycetes bacterium Pla86]